MPQRLCRWAPGSASRGRCKPGACAARRCDLRGVIAMCYNFWLSRR
ncbi:hypothetical protein BSIN_5048 [Burkholderia singularis]|uniref:Uncharacterized protein n=1 Tax=Burkholderia singularis TaxID=1503053 RepID=A0A238HB87_9BURK|nr:hypothetical protein BSIN_5048 [Burkholderia singularis]